MAKSLFNLAVLLLLLNCATTELQGSSLYSLTNRELILAAQELHNKTTENLEKYHESLNTAALHLEEFTLDFIIKDLTEKVNKNELKNWQLSIMKEELIFLESVILGEIDILEDLKQNYPKNPQLNNRTMVELCNEILALCNEFEERYPSAWEYPIMLNEKDHYQDVLETAKEKELATANFEKHVERSKRTIKLFLDRAQWRWNFNATVHGTVKEDAKHDIVDQIHLFKLLQEKFSHLQNMKTLAIAHLNSYEQDNSTHLTLGYQYTLYNLDQWLSHLDEQMSNSKQYFPHSYLRLIFEMQMHFKLNLNDHEKIISEMKSIEQAQLNPIIIHQAPLMIAQLKDFAQQYKRAPETVELVKELEAFDKIMELVNSTAINDKNSKRILTETLYWLEKSSDQLMEKILWREKLNF